MYCDGSAVLALSNTGFIMLNSAYSPRGECTVTTPSI